MMLNYQTFGDPSNSHPLLIIHGLFGSGRNWRAIAKHLSSDRQVYTVDMRNHGDSFHANSNTYFDMADDLKKVINHLGGPFDVLGHSMGGKAAMILALQHSDLVNRLIVADISPVSYEHSLSPNIDAMRSVPIKTIERRAQADDIMSKQITDPNVRAFLLQSLKINPDNNSWALNLDVLEKDMNHIVGFPEIDNTFSKSTLFIKGGSSDYVHPNYGPIIKRYFPNSSIQTIDGAGHWIHADAPRQFMIDLKNYLND